MRRILWYGNPPDAASGYGVQAGLFVPRIAELGYEVAVAANTRVNLPPTEWRGFKVYSEGIMEHGADSLRWHYEDWGADLLLMLTDAWQISPETVRGCNTAAWLPVDSHRVGVRDLTFIRGASAHAIAMSRHGQRRLQDAGIRAPYVPHGVDTKVFYPRDREEARDELGVTADAFVIGINAQNVRRKALPQAMAGIARFAKRHDGEVVVLLHSTVQRGDPGSPYLPAVIEDLGIQSLVRWGNHYSIVTCLQDADSMARWYSALDVLLAASMGEGFGVPIIEAQACGVPVIGTRASTMPELIPPACGWLAGGIRDWADGHHAWWVLPDDREIADALTQAAEEVPGSRREACVGNASNYDADKVTGLWKPVLEELTS